MTSPRLQRRGNWHWLPVGLDDATRDQHVSLGYNSLMKDIVELAQLFAAKARPVASSRFTHKQAAQAAVRRLIGSEV